MCANIARKQFGHEQGRSGITNSSRPAHGGGSRGAITHGTGGMKMKCKTVSHRCMVAMGAVAAVATLLIPARVGADTITTNHDPNANGAAAASTVSDCTGVVRSTISYTINNEGMENDYTIDWTKPPGFRVTVVPALATRKTTLPPTLLSCPNNPSNVEWIDIPPGDLGAVAPHRGTQAFPNRYHFAGWVVLSLIGDLISVLDLDGDADSTRAAFVTEQTADGVPIYRVSSIGAPVSMGDVQGLWQYTFRFENLTSRSAAISNETVGGWTSPSFDKRFTGPVGPNSVLEVSFTGGAPRGYGPGLVHIDFGDDNESMPILALATSLSGRPALPGWAGIALAALLFVAGAFVFGNRRREPAT